jgi:hypothetical protein
LRRENSSCVSPDAEVGCRGLTALACGESRTRSRFEPIREDP